MKRKSVKPLVSIAFMLKYWGPTMDEFFRRLKSQKTKYPYEIVIAFYGDDNTYKKVKSLVSKVKRIKPRDYNCGSTRDIACSLATGKYIVTMSVDALPFNDQWLNDNQLMKNFKNRLI